MDEECLRSIQESKTLAGIFQSIVDDSKILHPAIDDFIGKSRKLENQIRSTIFAFSAFLESLQKIAYKAANTKGSSQDIGACLVKISIHHKATETQLTTLSNSLANGLALKYKNEEHKKKIKALEKNHLKEFKLVRKGIKRRVDTIHKLRKKDSKENFVEVQKQIASHTDDLYTEYKVLEKQERQAVRRINLEERSQFCDFAVCVEQVVKEEVAVMEGMGSIREVMKDMNKIINDPHNIPDTADKVINDIIESGTNYGFYTPATTVNGSLRGSLCGSTSSLVNSRSNSPLCISENNEKRIDRRAPIRSCTNSPRNGKQKLRAAEEKSIFAPSFYSQNDSTDLHSINPEQQSSVRRSRPSSSCEMYGRVREQSSSPVRHIRNENQLYSTIRRAHSPFRKPAVEENLPDKGSTTSLARRPPLPRKYQPADRPPIQRRCDSVDRVNTVALHDTAWKKADESSTTQFIPVNTSPRCLQNLNFSEWNLGQHGMVLPQPVPSNEMDKNNNGRDTKEDLETPTGENILNETMHQVEDTTSTSSVNSSGESGYWSYRPSDLKGLEHGSNKKTNHPPKSPHLLKLSQYPRMPVVSTVPKTHQADMLSTYPRQPHTPFLPALSQMSRKHNLWSDKILPRQDWGDRSDRQQLSAGSSGGGSNRQQLSVDSNRSDSEQFTKLSVRPVLDRSLSLEEPSVGRLSRLDLNRRSASLAERQMVLMKSGKNSDNISASHRMCRDNILQLLSDRLLVHVDVCHQGR